MPVFSVPDMSCGHCRASIEEALRPIGARVEFDQERREIRTEGAEAEAVIAALAAIGFESAPVAER